MVQAVGRHMMAANKPGSIILAAGIEDTQVQEDTEGAGRGCESEASF